MSIETAILTVVVVGGGVFAIYISFALAKCADEAHRLIQHKSQEHYGGETE